MGDEIHSAAILFKKWSKIILLIMPKKPGDVKCALHTGLIHRDCPQGHFRQDLGRSSFIPILNFSTEDPHRRPVGCEKAVFILCHQRNKENIHCVMTEL